MARAPTKRQQSKGLPGRVIETRGRRVLVRDHSGERVCFLSGQRAVVGDKVRWVDAQGTGGKLVTVERRTTALTRVDQRGKEQPLAANLTGIIAVTCPSSPPFRAGLLDRYWVAARSAGLGFATALNKIDQEIPPNVQAELHEREAFGLQVIPLSAHTGQGVSELRAFISSSGGPWALVGHSGVGKTSIVSALLPNQDVGQVGAISERWGTGQHTTTHSRVFAIGDGELVDSPGIRTFAPGGLVSDDVRIHFPAVRDVRCQYRDCQHRPDEAGCQVPTTVPATLLASYRRLQSELATIEQRQRP